VAEAPDKERLHRNVIETVSPFNRKRYWFDQKASKSNPDMSLHISDNLYYEFEWTPFCNVISTRYLNNTLEQQTWILLHDDDVFAEVLKMHLLALKVDLRTHKFTEELDEVFSGGVCHRIIYASFGIESDLPLPMHTEKRSLHLVSATTN
jgi:hypothetical protein